MRLTKKQSEILDISKKMFAESGFVETSMRDLAAVLEIKAASLYSHFKSKEEILEFICDEISNGMKEIMNTIKNSELNAEERFNLYIKLHLEYTLKNELGSQIYLKYWTLSDETHGKYIKINQDYFTMLTQLVRDRFPYEQQKKFYISDATVHFVMQTLNLIPKLINRDQMNIDAVVEDVKYRLNNGFKNEY